ncbi:MAG TPA: ATP-binding protein [Blastocatellia bacterium]|nr:ATP-binding protein [Blastocatellia bacterium]
MIGIIRRVLAPPVFQGDEDRTRTAAHLNAIVLGALAVIVLYTVVVAVIAPPSRPMWNVARVVFLIGVLILMRRGHVRLACSLGVTAAWVVQILSAASNGGVRTPGFGGMVVIVLMAGLLMGFRSALTFAALTIVVGLAMVAGEMRGLLPPLSSAYTPARVWATQAAWFLVAAVMLHVATLNMKEALKRERRELTERVRAEDALRESAEHLRLALGAARMGTWDWNTVTGGVRWSDNLGRLFGLGSESFTGTDRAFIELVHPEDRRFVIESATRALKERGDYYAEFRVVWPDKSIRWIAGMGEAYYDSQTGRPLRMTGVGIDITERKRAEEEKGRLQEHLRRSETMSALGQLVAGVAHEVRNPIFSISATLDAFEVNFGARAEYKRYIEVLHGELTRLNSLMQDLLDYGRPPSLELAEGNIADVIAGAVESCAQLAARLKVTVDNRVGPALGQLSMDKKRLTQVFQNLVENALQHSMPGGSVIVDAEDASRNGERWINCRIKDRGPGIREDDKLRVFEPFFTRRRGGTGLGLSIVQRIVEQHGGQVRVDNPTGGGAEIVVTLPLASVARTEAGESHREAVP